MTITRAETRLRGAATGATAVFETRLVDCWTARAGGEEGGLGKQRLGSHSDSMKTYTWQF